MNFPKEIFHSEEFIDDFPIFFVTIAADGKTLYMNESMLSAVGYTKEEVIGKDYLSTFIPESEKDKVSKIFEKLVYTWETAITKNGILTKDGRTLIVDWRGKQVLNERGEFDYFFGVGTDITDREHANEMVRESEEKYRALAHSVDPMYLVDNNCRYLFLNEGYLSRFEVPIENIIGKKYSDFHSEEEGKIFAEAVNTVIETGTSIQYEYISDKDGKYFLRTLSPSIDAYGKGKIVTVVAKDISDQKKAENTLRAERERFESLIKQLPAALILIDQGGTFKYINPKFKKTFGYDLEDVPNGRAWFTKAFPNDVQRGEAISAWYEDLQAHGDIERLPRTFNVTCKDGTTKTVSFTFTKLESSEYLMVCEDITHWKKLESQLLNSQKMEAIGILAGGIAHDFNNLLMGIQGYTSLMLLDTEFSHHNYDKLKNIEKQVKSGADLTRQLLGFAREGRYDIKSLNINDLLNKTIAVFGRAKKEITIHCNFEKDIFIVDADEGQIEHVLFNLYVNAWQAMPGGGELYLESSNVVLDEGYVRAFSIHPGNFVKISITDTGVGMDEKTKEKVFEPFFTTKEMRRGTGLGLATVYGIIKGHRGIINVDSEKGHGTTFNIYLPVSQKAAIKEQERVTKESSKTGGTILLVDDETMITDVTGEILKNLGYKVLIANSGHEAIELYKANREAVGLVIMDMIMPNMSGGETYDLLRRIDPNVKVILSSGYSLNGQASNIMKRGCVDFIQKPYSASDLSKKIQKVLSNSATLGMSHPTEE